MKIKRVTITGFSEADGETLASLLKEYPYMEAGFLVSSTRCGNGRYSSIEYLDRISREHFPRSLHLCGGYAKAAMLPTNELINMCKRYDRVQLNVNFMYDSPFNYTRFMKLVSPTPVIIQYNHTNNVAWDDCFRHIANAQLLFDESRGNGKAGVWQPPVYENVPHGYAGGLRPENIQAELKKIAEAAGDAEIWIDAESGARNIDDKLVIDRAAAILKAAGEYL